MKRLFLFALLSVMAFSTTSLLAEEQPSLADQIKSLLIADKDSYIKRIDRIVELNPAWKDVEAARESLYEPVETEGLQEAKIDIWGLEFNFFYSVPKGYNPKKSYPLIVSLTPEDGSPEKAKEIYNTLWESSANEYIVLQVPTKGKYIFESDKDMIMPVMRWAATNLHIDKERIYLAGASKAGIEAIDYYEKYPYIFAAVLACPGTMRSCYNEYVDKNTHIDVRNMIYGNFLLWVAQNDKQWLEDSQETMAQLKWANVSAELIIDEKAEHLPDKKVNVKKLFIGFFKKTVKPRPMKFDIATGSLRFMYNYEMVKSDKLGCFSCQRKNGKISFSNIDAVIRVFVAEKDLKGGKVEIFSGKNSIFNDKPPMELKNRLMAMYQSLLAEDFVSGFELNDAKQ